MTMFWSSCELTLRVSGYFGVGLGLNGVACVLSYCFGGGCGTS